MENQRPGQRPKGKDPNSIAKEKANAAKAYIEAKYSRMKSREEEKQQGWSELRNKMNEMNISQQEQQMIV